MRHPLYGEAVLNLYPQVRVVDDSLGILDGDGNQVIVDNALIEVEINRLQAEYEAKQYQRKRAAEYPSFADQFDLLYHGGYDAWKASIDAVKNKYPKG